MEMENEQRKDNSRIVIAFVMIGIGMIWLLRELGIYFEFPDIYIHRLFYPIRSVFSRLVDIILSWQSVLIFVGLLLLAGKRRVGIVMIIAGAIFLLPEIFLFTPFSIAFMLPALLIGAGVAMVSHLI